MSKVRLLTRTNTHTCTHTCTQKPTLTLEFCQLNKILLLIVLVSVLVCGAVFKGTLFALNSATTGTGGAGRTRDFTTRAAMEAKKTKGNDKKGRETILRKEEKMVAGDKKEADVKNAATIKKVVDTKKVAETMKAAETMKTADTKTAADTKKAADIEKAADTEMNMTTLRRASAFSDPLAQAFGRKDAENKELARAPEGTKHVPHVHHEHKHHEHKHHEHKHHEHKHYKHIHHERVHHTRSDKEASYSSDSFDEASRDSASRSSDSYDEASYDSESRSSDSRDIPTVAGSAVGLYTKGDPAYDTSANVDVCQDKRDETFKRFGGEAREVAKNEP